ncbi:LysM peptidoglycan-binding domain-containing protein [Embleya sp. NPDC008237]|uniref:LysM peptidoglycan-binding domain-containing protein n=1 Tax=Embleya sp. NPDC008237 TaxID=3363978 RepID=UPI0036E91F57
MAARSPDPSPARRNENDTDGRASARGGNTRVKLADMSTKTVHVTHYTVQSGNTLTAIAGMFGTTIEQLVKWNGIPNPDRIDAGQRLIVNESPTPHDTFYTVKSGDTLTAIARKYGTTIERLVQLNGIPDPNRIDVGQRLIVAKSAPAQA